MLIRDGALHEATFADHAPYLQRNTRGTAAGEPWFTDFGPELSRGFRALGVWFTMKTYGLDRFGELIARQCAMAHALGERIATTPPLELLATGGAEHRLLPLRSAASGGRAWMRSASA